MSHPPSPVHPRLTGPEISNPQSARLKAAAKLVGRTGRKRERRFLVEGPQAVREAVRRHGALRPTLATVGAEEEEHGRPDGGVVDVWATPEAADRHPEIIDLARDAGLRVRQATPEALAAVSDTVVSQGLIAVAEKLDAELADVLTREARLVVVLSQVRDPGNAGTVLRAADAAGADAVVLTSSSVDVYNPKTVRATAGSLFHLPVVTQVGLSEVAELARARGLQVLAADAHPPAHDLHVPWDTGLDLSRPTAWVFGNEAWGLPEADRAECDSAVAVPVYGAAESLNLATAAAVCIYESAKHVRL